MHKNVIISDVGGLKEIVPEGCGEVFAAGKVSDLVSKVRKMMSSVDIRQDMIQRANSFITERDWNKVVSRYYEIYQAIV